MQNSKKEGFFNRRTVLAMVLVGIFALVFGCCVGTVILQKQTASVPFPIIIPTPAPTLVPTPVNTAVPLVDPMVVAMTGYYDSLVQFQRLVQQGANEPTWLSDPKWKNLTYGYLDNLCDYSGDMAGIETGNVELNGVFDNMASETIDLRRNFRAGIENMDVDSLSLSIDNVDRVTGYLEQATSILDSMK
jgi:hypothetical protein